ncbi:MAG: adenine phosphoribosyltransferase [Propionibacteriaceae bacterium]
MDSLPASVDRIAALIRDIPDFPKPGVIFKDITPLLASAEGFDAAISELIARSPQDIDVVVGMEARGFIFAAPVALRLDAGFVPVRKPGKLPGKVVSQSYELEYGSETLSMHADAIKPGQRVLIVDDVLATGGTIAATTQLLQSLGAQIAGVAVLMELEFLAGRSKLIDAGLEHIEAVILVS